MEAPPASRPANAPDAPGRSALLPLGIALVMVLQPGRPAVATVIIAILLVTVMAAATRWDLEPVALLVLLGIGIELRYVSMGGLGSDVLTVTRSAIETALSGANPYGVGYASSNPPGAAFPYGPLALAWYLPSLDEPRAMELLSAGLVMVALAATRRPVGLALYATAPLLVITSVDGSNDTSAGLLLLLALVAAETRPILGAVLLGVAAAFKPYAAAWLPGLVAWAGLPAAGGFVGASAILWLPVLAWGPGSFLRSLQMADETHGLPFYSLGDVWQWMTGRSVGHSPFDGLRLVFGLLAAGGALRWVRSHDGVVLSGALVLVVTLYAGYWSTFAYLAALAPILCWKADGWLAALGSRRQVRSFGTRQGHGAGAITRPEGASHDPGNAVT